MIPKIRRRQICQRLVSSLFQTLFHAGRLLFRWSIHSLRRNRAETEALFGRTLREWIEAQGATFIKVGQVLSCRPDLLPAGVIAELVKLQDSVQPIPAGKIPILLEKAFGRPPETIFAEFDWEPVSSASVAQVHRARLFTGEVAAVKIRRPGLLTVVGADLKILSTGAGLIERLPGMHAVPFTELVGEIAEMIEQQLDFQMEAANNRRFRHNFRASQGVVIPRLYEELCTADVITMEFVEGLCHINRVGFCAAGRRQAAVLSLRALFQMMFVDGFIHADMHPGNVFFLPDGRFVLLDLGLVARLDGGDRKRFADFFFGMVTNLGRDCARVIFETAIWLAPHCRREAFEADMVDLVGRHSARVARDFEVTGFAAELFAVQRRHGVRGSTKFMTTILSLVVFENIARSLDPDLDFQAEARRLLPLVLRNVAAPRLEPVRGFAQFGRRKP